MNELYNYGIQNEESDIRAHVCVKAQKVYVFETGNWRCYVSASNSSLRTARQPGVDGITAAGYPVKITCMNDVRVVSLPNMKVWEQVTEKMSCKEKGEFAVKIVQGLLKSGEFPLWFEQVEEVTDKDLQISGTDIHIKADKHIQVKCDYKGGEGPGCTGNLFFQISERNPLHIH